MLQQQLERSLKEKDINVFKTAPIENLAKQTIQYQLFSISAALSKMNYAGYTKNTARQYFSAGRLYLRTKERNDKASIEFFDYIDKFVAQKLQPYTPAENERTRQIHKAKKVKQKPVQEPMKLTEKFEYGVKYENTIKIFDSENECKAFIEGASLFTGTYFEIVSVVLGEL